jgi:bacillithiol biosynthesis deacetylase BshB1
VCDVLAIGPHPDDMELAAGATLAQLTQAGKEVVLLDLTLGERGTRGSAEIRSEEARNAARILGAERRCLHLPDTGVRALDEDQIESLVNELRRLRPRLVLAAHGDDDHPDHREGAELVRRAVYLSGLRRFGSGDREAYRPERLLFAMGRRPFLPSLIVDVTGTYAIKRQALAAFDSQFQRTEGDTLVTPISNPGFLPSIEARDRYFGSLIGVTFGEAFLDRGPVAVTQATSLIPGGDAG